MDEVNDNPIEINRFHVAKLLHVNVLDLKRKRKLEDEQLDLPIAKHKFQYGGPRPHNESPLADDSETKEVLHISIIHDRAKVEVAGNGSELGFDKDSNCFVGESDFARSVYAEANCKPDYAQIHPNDQASTSSGSCSNRFKNAFHSLDSRVVTKTHLGEHEQTFTGSGQIPLPLKDALQMEEEYQSPKDQLSEFGKYADHISSEHKNDGIEQYPDEEHEDMLLYSSGITSNLSLLSYGKSSINQDPRLSVRRKPTIDQEFEQYFSSLMH